jgi:hypothetical protein
VSGDAQVTEGAPVGALSFSVPGGRVDDLFQGGPNAAAVTFGALVDKEVWHVGAAASAVWTALAGGTPLIERNSLPAPRADAPQRRHLPVFDLGDACISRWGVCRFRAPQVEWSKAVSFQVTRHLRGRYARVQPADLLAIKAHSHLRMAHEITPGLLDRIVGCSGCTLEAGDQVHGKRIVSEGIAVLSVIERAVRDLQASFRRILGKQPNAPAVLPKRVTTFAPIVIEPVGRTQQRHDLAMCWPAS